MVMGDKVYFIVEAALLPPDVTLTPSCSDLFKLLIACIRDCVDV